jgi:hypothetical protein
MSKTWKHLFSRSKPKGKILFRGKKLEVFLRDGYRGFYFKDAPRLIQGWQCVTDPHDFRSEFVELQAACAMAAPRLRRVAVLGLGVGTIPRTLQLVSPPVRIESVEIEPEVLDIAQSWFGLQTSERLKVSVGDARQWVQGQREGRYDLVTMDCFDGNGLSAACRDPQFFDQLRRIVNPRGLITFNLIKGRPENRVVHRELSRITKGCWAIPGQRKSNLAVFGSPGQRLRIEECVLRAGSVDRRRCLPFRMSPHVKRMERWT